jgi:hypothetical protein
MTIIFYRSLCTVVSHLDISKFWESFVAYCTTNSLLEVKLISRILNCLTAIELWSTWLASKVQKNRVARRDVLYLDKELIARGIVKVLIEN